MALVLFFEDRHQACALACTAAVLSKETSVLLPLVFAAVLFRERRLKEYALVYAIPFVTLCVWLLALWGVTGTPFGNRGFEHYNITYSLNPVRVVFAFLRRLYYLFFDNFRWVGTVVIVLSWRRFHIYSSRAWRVTMSLRGRPHHSGEPARRRRRAWSRARPGSTEWKRRGERTITTVPCEEQIIETPQKYRRRTELTNM